MVLITSTSRSHIESYIKWFQKLSSYHFLLMGNLLSVLSSRAISWGHAVGTGANSLVHGEWGTAHLPGLEGILCPLSSSLFRNQWPLLSPPCLKTSSNGSFGCRAAHHFCTAFTVRSSMPSGRDVCIHGSPLCWRQTHWAPSSHTTAPQIVRKSKSKAPQCAKTP